MTHKTPDLSKFTDAFPIIPLLRPHQKGNSFTYYKVRMTECRLSLHRELNPSTLWYYENSYPGPVIEVESGEKTYIKWINNLKLFFYTFPFRNNDRFKIRFKPNAFMLSIWNWPFPFVMIPNLMDLLFNPFNILIRLGKGIQLFLN